MSGARSFFDTNVLLYLQSAGAAKADRAEELIAGGGVISVQVLNEFVAVATRKLAMSLAEIRDVLSVVRSLCAVEPLTPTPPTGWPILLSRRVMPKRASLTVLIPKLWMLLKTIVWSTPTEAAS